MADQDETEIVELTSEQVGVPLWLLVAEALRSNNDRMHEPALAICEALGAVFQPLLFRELRLGNTAPKHRVRLLQALGRTRPIRSAAEVASLFLAMMRDKHPDVRSHAAELFYGMRDRQRPFAAERGPGGDDNLGLSEGSEGSVVSP